MITQLDWWLFLREEVVQKIVEFNGLLAVGLAAGVVRDVFVIADARLWG